ncbi:MAG: hypothetical protein JSV38_01110 [Desulfobacterales bacterium]|nr:MAG: hypothetical protein JSV38_01110 [Desulfobacterales bacterium]
MKENPLKKAEMKTFPFILILICFILVGSTKIHAKRMYQSIPKQIGKWEAQGQDEIYDRSNLYKYINGGAELYLAYDFKEVLVRRFVGSDNTEIILFVYNMGSSNDAFGVFSVEREDEDIGIGQDSEYGGGYLRFWKGIFFITIMTYGDAQAAKSTVIKLARKIDSLINIKGSRPEMIEALPREGLYVKSLKFFHTAPILNRQYYLAEKNILMLNKNTDCVLSKYNKNQNSAIVLLIQYQKSEQAKIAYNTFIRSYMPEAEDSGIARMENKTWTMVKKDRNFIVLVFEATQHDYGVNLLSSIQLKKK